MLPLRTHNGPDRDPAPDKVGWVLLEIGGAIPNMEPRNGRVHRHLVALAIRDFYRH